MRDGLDQTGLAAELKAMSREEQRRRVREVYAWMRAAARSVGWWMYMGFIFTVFGVALLMLVFVGHSPVRMLTPIGLVALAVGTALSLRSNRRAREWRRAHPFEEWLASKERLG